MRESSLRSLKERLRKYPHLDELERFLTRVQQDSPVAVILYGSLARGDFSPRSDIDVLCVFDRQFTDPRERFMIAYKHSDGIVQTKTMNLEEFKDGLLNGNTFLHGVVSDGILLQGTIDACDINQWASAGLKKVTVSQFPP